MAISLSLAVLFEDTFGYMTDAFEPQPKALPTRKKAGKYGSPLYDRGHNGREYYMPVSVGYGEKTIMMPAPVIAIESAKTLVKTELTERSSPVTEFINRQGYKINIKGFCIGTANELPEDQIERLNEMYMANSTVIMRCAYTDIFLIDCGFRVVIESLRFPAMAGVQGVKAYEINAYSDEEYNLIDIR